MFLALIILLGLSAVVSATPLHDVVVKSTGRLQKRAFVLDCEDNGPPPVEANQFHTLSDLCRGYPHGVGLICDVDGHVTQRTPISLISRTYGNDLTHICLNHCQCNDIAPDAPTLSEALNAHLGECSVSNETVDGPAAGGSHPEPSNTATCSQDQTTEESHFMDSCDCDEFWYGKPNNEDCIRAMLRLPDHGSPRSRLREFHQTHDQPYHRGTEGPPVRTPIISTHGRCSISVLLPEGPGTSRSIIVDTFELNRAADDLRSKCVQSFNMGGKFHQSNEIRSDQLQELPEIVIYAPDSSWKEFLALKYGCEVDAKGNYQCGTPKSTSRPRTKQGAYSAWKYMGTIGSQGWTPVGSSKGSNPRNCHGSCLDPTDCDINSDCVCASNKGIPLSSSWGHNTCTYVAGAAAAISAAAAALKPQVCRGRCLLQGNGTKSGNETSTLAGFNSTVISFDAMYDQAPNSSTDSSVPVPSNADQSPPTAVETETTILRTGTTTFTITAATASSSTTVILGNNTIPDSEDPETVVEPDASVDSSVQFLDNSGYISNPESARATTQSSSSNALPSSDPLYPDGSGPINTNESSKTPVQPPDPNQFPSGPDTPGYPDSTFPNDTTTSTSPSSLPLVPQQSSSSFSSSSSFPSEESDPTYAIFNTTADSTALNASTLDPASQEQLDDQLTCPCNCTYISASCCLSPTGIVYEPPSMRDPDSDAVPGDNDLPVCCNKRTGHWSWKSSGLCSEEVVNGSAVWFIGLGGRRWNGTFDRNMGFGDGTDGGELGVGRGDSGDGGGGDRGGFR